MNIILARPAGVCLHGRLSSNVRPRRNKLSWRSRRCKCTAQQSPAPHASEAQRSQGAAAALTSFGVRGEPLLGSSAAEYRRALGRRNAQRSRRHRSVRLGVQPPSCGPMHGVGVRRHCSLHAWARRGASRQAGGLLRRQPGTAPATSFFSLRQPIAASPVVVACRARGARRAQGQTASLAVTAAERGLTPRSRRRPAPAGALGRAASAVYDPPHGQARPPPRSA